METARILIVEDEVPIAELLQYGFQKEGFAVCCAQTAGAAAAQSARDRVVFYDQVSLDFIVQSIPRSIRRDLAQLVFSSCTPEEKDSFVQTIQLYFQEDGDLARCAQRSFVHRNTVQYHIDRLKKKTGYDLRIPGDSLLLYVAAQEAAHRSSPQR